VVLDAFLARHADSSMFLRSNARAAGLVDRGEPGQGTYVAAFEHGVIVGVAAHCWNGMVLVQAPGHVATLAREAVRRSGRTVAGFSGPWDQVVAARHALGLSEGTTRKTAAKTSTPSSCGIWSSPRPSRPDRSAAATPRTQSSISSSSGGSPSRSRRWARPPPSRWRRRPGRTCG